MIGTIVNTAAIVIGSSIGAGIHKALGEKYQNAMFNAMGLAAFGLGIHAIVQNMSLSVYPVLFIVSLGAGSLFGTLINIEGRFQRFAGRFAKAGAGQGLSTAILLFCIGTLSILGPIESALNHNNTYLYTNAALDFVSSIVLASTYGFSIALAAVVLFLWQGGIYLFAGSISTLLTDNLLHELSLVGGFLLLSSGLSILKIKDNSTLNMLPSLLIPVLWFIIRQF